MQIAYSKSKSRIEVMKKGFVSLLKNGLMIKLAIEISSCLEEYMLVSHRCSTSISVVRLAYQYAIVKRAASKMNGNGYEKNGENNPAGRIFLVTVGSTIQWKIVTSTVQVSNCSR
jgi:hypothetical protein